MDWGFKIQGDIKYLNKPGLPGDSVVGCHPLTFHLLLSEIQPCPDGSCFHWQNKQRQ